MNWQKKIVSSFVLNAGTNIWVVYDPDSAIRNEQVMAQLQSKGFESLFFEDPLAFRYEYESRIRRAWERGHDMPVIVIFDDRTGSFDDLPSDVLQNATRFEFSMQHLFPEYDSSVLQTLPPAIWNILENHAKKHPGKSFNKADTQEIALRLGYQIVPDVIDSIPELFRRLIDLHRRSDGLPKQLGYTVASALDQKTLAGDIPAGRLCVDQVYFWKYLKEKWNQFVHESLDHEQDASGNDSKIPFEDPLLRGYMEVLFEEGVLEKTDIKGYSPRAEDWWSFGVNIRTKRRREVSAESLQALLKHLPAEGINSRQWIEFSLQYSKLVSSLYQESRHSLTEQFWEETWPEVDGRFLAWLKQGYGGLHNLPANPPSMQHHIPKQLNRFREKGDRVALIVLDGLSMAGWFSIADTLKSQMKYDPQVNTSGVFAWLPTLTPVCRQSLYAGQTPWLFPDTINRTDKDAFRWKAFWEGSAELLPSKLSHGLVEGDLDDAEFIIDNLGDKLEVLGLTVSKPDKLMHHTILGWAEWHQNLALWMNGSFLSTICDKLLAAGFVVCLTADHGNLEAIGSGKINQGVLAEKRGERTRIYSNETLQKATLGEQVDCAFALDTAFVPDGKFPVFAKGRRAFVKEGDIVVAHGGISLDEVIVPWVVMTGGKA